MNANEIEALHRKYATDDRAYELVYTHCKIVADIAVDAVEKSGADVDKDIVYLACILHDLGTYALYIPELDTFKSDGYQQHALIGAALLEAEGLPPEVVSAVRTHVLMGLSADEIKDVNWKLPYIDLSPETEIGELLCYADRFHSKHPQFNDPDNFIERLSRDLPLQADKFRMALERYGRPDIEALAKQYNHPIK